MGQHAMQCRNAHGGISDPSGFQLAYLSVPGISDPDVGHLFGRSRLKSSDKAYRFVPADALWNLAMAINVYLTLFKKYNAQQLKALEWKYHLMCYGGPFVIAFTFIFVETQSRGKIYGPAVVRLPSRLQA